MTLEPLEPFGRVVHLAPGTPWSELDPRQLHAWVLEHRVLVLRGLVGLDRTRLPVAARTLGPLQVWSFGSVNVLEVDPTKENYLFTPSGVPLHWDGAFRRQIPDLLVFRCERAPVRGAGGGTVFVDAVAALQAQPAEVRAAWSRARFRYTTERVVHYGGTIEQDLVATHPRTGEATLRFAEPVHDLNPVRVEALHEGAPRASEVARALADPAHRLVHCWQAGDVVLADNHALLHGREPFALGVPRELHRVNVLGPERPWWRGLVDSARIRRPEFLVAEIPILLLALLWARPDGAWLASSRFWVATAVFFGLFHVGDMLNCLADRDLDAAYKTSLSEAVYGLGVRQVRAQIGATIGLVLAGTVYLAAVAGQAWLLPLVVAGLGLGHQYSYGPLRLKSRGLWQPLTLWILIFVGPSLLVLGAVHGPPDPWLLALVGAYGALAQSTILVNTAEDLEEDIAAGLRTSAVVLGRDGALWASAAGVGGFGLGLLALLRHTLMSESTGALAWFVLGVWTAAWAWTTLEIGSLAWRVGHTGHPDRELKQGARRMPIWITVVAWSTLAVAGARAWTA